MFIHDLHDVVDSRAFKLQDKQQQLAAYDDAEARRQQIWKLLRQGKA